MHNMSDSCQYEGDIAVLKRICEKDIPEMKEFLGKIFNRLEGNNGVGLVTRMALVEQELNVIKDRVPTMQKAMKYGTIWGGVSGAATIILFFGIKALI